MTKVIDEIEREAKLSAGMALLVITILAILCWGVGIGIGWLGAWALGMT